MNKATNETINTLLSRRSTKCFDGVQITDFERDEIIKAGLYAASGLNCQPWYFAVVQSREIIDRLIENNKTGDCYYGAPTVVIAFADMNSCTPVQSVSLALGNMMIAAESLNVGACWVNRTPTLLTDDILDKLDAPEGYTPLASLALGYLKGDKPQLKPRKENSFKIIR